MMKNVLQIALTTLAGLFMLSSGAYAQGDEIQVYDGGLAPVGVANLTWHNNFTPKGVKQPAFPGAIKSDKSLNGVPEWAYGVTPWFEAGLYLPLYSVDTDRGAVLDGFKLRTLFAVPHADDRRFVYGANFEFSYNARYWDAKRFTSEIRPIIGWHLGTVDVLLNPILDTSYDGVKNLTFVPSARLAFTVPRGWQVAVEEYSDYGAVRHFYRTADQVHQLFAVVDHAGGFVDIEAGIGFGLTDTSDKVQLKLIVSKDLNRQK